jgi:general L-amino acid transport system substrate-binding protein
MVQARGTLLCGVNQGLTGFAEADASGRVVGFDADFCRAVAAAVLKDAENVTFVPLSATERFEALQAGKIDLLSRNSTWTLDREGLGLLFAGITYHDGQGFLVVRRPNVTSALELGDTRICVQAGTTSAANLADFVRANALIVTPVLVGNAAEAVAALKGGDCDVFSADNSALHAEKAKLSGSEAAMVLPDIISKEPFAPVVRADDVAWFNIVKWVGFALINAEELGISRARLAEAMASTKPDVRRFTGAEGHLGAALGLDDAWAVRIVAAVGHYGEMFDAHLGTRSRLAIPRGLNAGWANGGILYAPPLR